MNGGERVVTSLIDRLSSKLPRRSGFLISEVRHDEVVLLTRNTLVQISKTAFEVVFDGLVGVLDDLAADSRFDPEADEIVQTIAFVVELLADCCSEHWSTIYKATLQNGDVDGGSRNVLSPSPPPSNSSVASSEPQNGLKSSSGPSTRGVPHTVLPPALDEARAAHVLALLTQLITPVPEDGQVPLTMLLETGPWAIYSLRRNVADPLRDSGTKVARPRELDRAAFEVLEYVSASNWNVAFSFLQIKLRGLRAMGQSSGPPGQNSAESSKEVDLQALKSLQILAHLWVDGKKLSLIIHELCGCFLNLRKNAQNAIAVLFPGLIARWIENNPAEFVELHVTESRLDSGADALFDMAVSMADDPRRKIFMWPFQGTLLLLIPEVFWVAGDLRDSRNAHVAKKAAFLEGLKKSLRSSRNSSTAILCLIGFCAVATYFPEDSDAALVSFVLDVQNDLRDEILRAATSPDSQRDELHLMIAAFVCLSRLNLRSVAEHLIPNFTKPDSPIYAKITLFASCVILASQPDSDEYRELYRGVVGFIRAYLGGPFSSPSSSVNSIELTNAGTPSDMFKSKELQYCMLEFLGVRPSTIYDSVPVGDTGANNSILMTCFDHFIHLLTEEDPKVRQLADNLTRRMTIESAKWWVRRTREVGTYEFLQEFWGITSKLVDSRIGGSSIVTLNHFVRDFLEKRLVLWHTYKKGKMSLEDAGDVVERSGVSKDVEAALLVLLCSTELRISSAVRNLLACFCDPADQPEASLHAASPAFSIARNFEVYSQLASPDLRITGMVAFQKRFRRLLSQMTTPTSGMLTAWERVFRRWKRLSTIILESSQAKAKGNFDERTLVEWRNFSGLLASLGGFCVAESPAAARVADSMLAGLRWIDRIATEENGQSLLTQFVSICIRLMVCNNVRVREATIDMLGTELSPRLYAPLFQALESQLTQVFNNSGEGYSLQYRVLVLEQVASLLRTIVDRLDDFSEPILATDFGTLTLYLAKPVQTIDLESAVWRVKIKICQLCEAVTCKRDTLRLRHDIEVRGQLFEVLVGWMSLSSSTSRDNLSATKGMRPDEVFRLQRDLDRACLRACVHLTYQLPLHPSERQGDTESSELRSDLFQVHFQRFFSLISLDKSEPDQRHGKFGSVGRAQRDDTSQNSELAITVLSNLLSANIDVGLKQSLEIGYHENLETRAAFMRILRNILNEGGGLERLSERTIGERYDALLQLFLDDMDLTVALCDSCPSNEVDEIAVILLNVFHSRGMGLFLLRTLVEREVATTENESELLRRNCVATKLLTVYAKWNGAEYLKVTLQQLLTHLLESPNALNLELDPARATSPEELQRNALNLRDTTQIVIDSIVGSSDKTPPIFCKICHIIASAVTQRFPNAKFTAVGSFIFLRFFCPAIVAPDSEGLVTSSPSKEMRRGLLLIGKVVQNLANNVLFGVKEPYMAPLNDFLAQNIWDVTAFLRTISAPVTQSDKDFSTEAFDFGSSVVLHRFLYQHWDSVKQKMLSRERVRRRDDSPATASDWQPQDHQATINELELILPSLGTPPSDFSWTRPSIYSNSPPMYAGFQQFMFKNATRNAELSASSQVVYEGGYSLDQLPVMCLILRNCELRATDRDLVLYSYLRTASRLWHKPFGLFVDITCHNSPAESNEIFANLEAYIPSEFQKNLTRIYIYNVNSTYRKSWRRTLRLTLKNEESSFHPSNVEYCMIGGFSELQSHFNLNALHLPKDTVSVVTDSRATFSPVVRLSRTKGKVDVVIRTGSQFVQITTVKKQEMIPELRFSTTVNDIFHVKDLEEASAKTQTEDDNAFGLRTENGKVIMFFTSPRKYEILQAIKAAKARYSRDTMQDKSSERHIRPEDIPGTLLNIALMNLASSNDNLRRTSYNLLCGLCKAFGFGLEKEFVSTKDLDLPAHSVKLVVGISTRLAQSEPQVTSDFLTEFFVSWDKAPIQQRTLNLLYMTPWLSNLRRHILLPETDGESGREKVASFARRLVDIATQEANLSTALQQHVWPVMAQDEVLVDILLDDMIKVATASDPDNVRGDRIASIAAGLSSTIVRGKLITRLRRILNRSSLRPTRNLADNAVWDEICVLLRICLAVSFGSGPQSQLFLPELFHIITMVVNSGSLAMRHCVHKLLVNTVHAMCISFPLDDVNLDKLKACLASLSEPKVELLFTLHTFSTGDGTMASTQQGSGSGAFFSTEAIAELLLDIINASAPSIAIANQWRARWMSLVASTAFQSNPAIQPRAFTVMGCLTRDDVDDDLLYQVLVSLKSGVHRFAENEDSELLVAIMATLTKMMSKLSRSSRYILQLFWLAMSLVRLAPSNFYERAALLFDAVLHKIASSSDLKDGKMAPVLLKGRLPIEEAASKIDALYGLRFLRENFHVASSACLLRGLTDSTTKTATLRVLSSLLEITSMSAPKNGQFPKDVAVLPYLGLVAARATSTDDSRSILRLAGAGFPLDSDSPADVFAMIDLDRIGDKDLLLNAALSIIDFRSCEDNVQQRTLTFLNRLATQRPSILLRLYNPLTSILNDVLASSQTTIALRAGQELACTLAANSQFTQPAPAANKLETILGDAGLSGIWTSSSFKTPKEVQYQCAVLIERLIELIVG
ncbi:MAG: 3-dehydroquinate dehydratase (3-dehydroquinase) [Chaenotheca gracillima]|nr:MAG: 3-dehydroquinate dehydratase (3-dehydroquinase) [Chaenotheca gracillima]